MLTLQYGATTTWNNNNAPFSTMPEDQMSPTTEQPIMTTTVTTTAAHGDKSRDVMMTSIIPEVRFLCCLENKDLETCESILTSQNYCTALPDIHTTFHQKKIDHKIEDGSNFNYKKLDNAIESVQPSLKAEPKQEGDWEEEKYPRTFTTLTVAKDEGLKPFVKLPVPENNFIDMEFNHSDYFEKSPSLIKRKNDQEERIDGCETTLSVNKTKTDLLHDACNEIFHSDDEYISDYLDISTSVLPRDGDDVNQIDSNTAIERVWENTDSLFKSQSEQPNSMPNNRPDAQKSILEFTTLQNSKNGAEEKQNYTLSKQLSDPTVGFYGSSLRTEPKIHQIDFLHNTCEHILSSDNCPTDMWQVPKIIRPKGEVELNTVIDFIVNDIKAACNSLQLNSDPQTWSTQQVLKWVDWAVNYNLLPHLDLALFSYPGSVLCKMSKDEMLQRAPRHGDILHAYLEIWRAGNNKTAMTFCLDEDSRKRRLNIPFMQEPYQKKIKIGISNNIIPNNFSQTSSVSQNHLPNSPNSLQQFSQSDHRSEKTNAPSAVNSSTIIQMTPNHTAGIHLWQFLKELLLQPQAYDQYIRWVDKEKGVFKIEDSVEVARLWGIRKNRPAMNYDKLSRSIRQYYKKGIIKKTTVSRRLVYQFVEPSKCFL